MKKIPKPTRNLTQNLSEQFVVWFLCAICLQMGSGEMLYATEIYAKERALPASRHTLHWENVPLRRALTRLAEAANGHMMIDRRVDPSRPVTLAIENASFDEIVTRVSQQQGLSTVPIGDLWYIGLDDVCRDIQTLLAKRSEASEWNPRTRAKLDARLELSWPKLSLPSAVVKEMLSTAAINVSGDSLIPYDLWPAGNLPELTVAQTLGLLLIGFDLTYSIDEDGAGLKIVPLERPVKMSREYPLSKRQESTLGQLEQRIPNASLRTARGFVVVDGSWQDHQEILAFFGKRPARRTAPQRAKSEKQVFTLRVRDQRADRLVNHLAKQLSLEVDWDNAAIQAAGLSPSRHVSFSVKEVNLDELFQSILHPAGLSFRLEEGKLSIGPLRSEP